MLHGEYLLLAVCILGCTVQSSTVFISKQACRVIWYASQMEEISRDRGQPTHCTRIRGIGRLGSVPCTLSILHAARGRGPGAGESAGSSAINAPRLFASAPGAPLHPGPSSFVGKMITVRPDPHSPSPLLSSPLLSSHPHSPSLLPTPSPHAHLQTWPPPLFGTLLGAGPGTVFLRSGFPYFRISVFPVAYKVGS